MGDENNVVSFAQRVSQRGQHRTEFDGNPASDIVEDYYSALGREIEERANALLEALASLERDGYQAGTDVIGDCLNDLELLRLKWFTDRRNDHDEIPW